MPAELFSTRRQSSPRRHGEHRGPRRIPGGSQPVPSLSVQSPCPSFLRGKTRTRGKRRGVSLLEMLATTVLIGFVSVATCQLYTTVNRQQRTARNYGQMQTDIREGIRTALRIVRHGFAVVDTDTAVPDSSLS